MSARHNDQRIRKLFEKFWGVKLPTGVDITLKKSKALCKEAKEAQSPAPEYTLSEFFEMLFQVKPSLDDRTIAQKCPEWLAIHEHEE